MAMPVVSPSLLTQPKRYRGAFFCVSPMFSKAAILIGWYSATTRAPQWPRNGMAIASTRPTEAAQIMAWRANCACRFLSM